MQGEPHVCVAALAAPVAAALTPPTIVSVATAASTFLLIDSTCMHAEVMTNLPSEDLTGCDWWRHGACSPHLPRRARESPSPPPGLKEDQGIRQGVDGRDKRRPAGQWSDTNLWRSTDAPRHRSRRHVPGL